MKIVSLLPSATEIVCAIGGRDALVGVSHECDHPADVVGLPVLTRARCLSDASSAAIDRSVRDAVRDALAVYEIDEARLAALAPDAIVTQDLCDVCAVSLDDVRRATRERLGPNVRIVSLSPWRLGDVFGDIERTGRELGLEDGAARCLEGLHARVDAVRVRARTAPTRPRVLTIEWIDPVMLGGTWMPELIALAGGLPLGVHAGDKAPAKSRAELAAFDPEVVLVKPCGFPLERALAEVDVLRQAVPWDRWSAVREGRVYVADGNAYFNRPGPRIVDSLEILAGCIHPEVFGDFRALYDRAVVRIDARGAEHAFGG